MATQSQFQSPPTDFGVKFARSKGDKATPIQPQPLDDILGFIDFEFDGNKLHFYDKRSKKEKENKPKSFLGAIFRQVLSSAILSLPLVAETKVAIDVNNVAKVFGDNKGIREEIEKCSKKYNVTIDLIGSPGIENIIQQSMQRQSQTTKKESSQEVPPESRNAVAKLRQQETIAQEIFVQQQWKKNESTAQNKRKIEDDNATKATNEKLWQQIKNRLKQIAAELEKITIKITRLREESAIHQLKINEKDKEIESLDSELKKVTNLIIKREQEAEKHHETKEKLAGQLAMLNKALGATQQEITSILTHIKEINITPGDHARYNKNLNGLINEQNALKKAIEPIQKEYDDIAKKFADVKKTFIPLTQKKTEIEKAQTNLKQEKKKLVDKKQKTDNEIKQLEAKKKEYEAEEKMFLEESGEEKENKIINKLQQPTKSPIPKNPSLFKNGGGLFTPTNPENTINPAKEVLSIDNDKNGL